SAQPPTDERLNAIISQAQPMPTDLETARTEALRTQTQTARAAAARRQAMIDRILGGAGAAPVGAPATAPVMAPEAPVAEPVPMLEGEPGTAPLAAPGEAVAPGMSFGAEPSPLPAGVPAIGEGAAAAPEAPRTVGEVFQCATPAE